MYRGNCEASRAHLAPLLRTAISADIVRHRATATHLRLYLILTITCVNSIYYLPTQLTMHTYVLYPQPLAMTSQETLHNIIFITTNTDYNYINYFTKILFMNHNHENLSISKTLLGHIAVQCQISILDSSPALVCVVYTCMCVYV